MMKFDILHRDTKIVGRIFLEASAGTGKTFAIEHLVCRSILEKDIGIEQILCITFTRAAARDLKRRIKANLQATLKIFDCKMAVFDYQKAILDKIEQNEETKILFKRRIELALSLFDEAQIFTIHGFCHLMLKNFTLESNFILGNFTESLESQVEGAIRDFLRIEFKMPSYSLAQIEKFSQNYDNNFRDLKKVILELLSGSKCNLSDYDQDQMLVDFTDKIRGLSVDEGLFFDNFSKLSSFYLDLKPDKYLEQAQILMRVIKTGKCSFQDFNLLSEDSFLQKTVVKNRKKRLKNIEEFKLMGFFEFLGDNLYPILRKSSDTTSLLLKMAKAIVSRGISDAGDPFSYDDILNKMKDFLELEGFLNFVRDKYKCVIIDEFQDTDPVQWKIFRKLFLESEFLINDSKQIKSKVQVNTICLVGDPKQAIYSFRRADIYTYLEALKYFSEDERFSLDTNFRSCQSLVNIFNILFSSEKNPEWLQLPKLNSKMKCNEINCGKTNIYPDSGVLHFFLAKNPQLFFSFIAEKIVELRGVGISYKEMCVLVTDRFQARDLARFLTENKIPTLLETDENLDERLAFSAVEDFLKAILYFEKPSSIKKFLMGPLVGLKVEEASTEKELEYTAFCKECFDCWEEEGFEGIISKLFSKQEIKNNAFNKNEEFYNDFRQVVEVLLEYEAQNFGSIFHLLSFMEDQRKLGDNEKIKVKRTSFDEKVSLMTIYKSKGLEFEVVFALALAFSNIKKERFIKVGSLLKPFFNEDEEAQSFLKEKAAENMRQLYVALTRAKSKVYVPILLQEKKTGSYIENFLETLKTNLAYMGTEIIAGTENFLIELSKKAPITYSFAKFFEYKRPLIEDVELICPEDLDISIKKIYLKSFSSMIIHEPMDFNWSKFGSQLSAGAKTQQDKSQDLPKGSLTGDVIHRILERVFYNNLHKKEDEAALEIIIREEIRLVNMNEFFLPILRIVRGVLSMKLKTETDEFYFKDIDVADQEMEFLIFNKDSFVKGFIDLVFRRGDKYYFVDWKSNFLGESILDYEEGQLKKSMEENKYFLQASIYKNALQLYLEKNFNLDFEKSFGGAFYIFVRAPAVYYFIPDSTLSFNLC